MRFLLILLFISSCYVDAFSQSINPKSDQPTSGSSPWTGLEVDVPDGQFQFVIVSDRTGGLRPGVFSKAVDKINLLQPQFVMSVGDLITGYTEDQVELNRQWDEFDAMIDRLEAPFFYVPGNHDITNQVMEDLYKERYGPTYYSFVYEDVLFLCLNSEDQRRGAGRGTISDVQYAWIAETLSNHKDAKWTMVFLHQPLWDQENPERWPDVEKLLNERNHTIYAGHVHHYQQFSRNNGKYYTLATTGGGSRLRGPKLGEFDQVSWITMTDDGPIMANIDLDGIYADSVTTKSDFDFISSLYANQPVRFDPIFADKISADGLVNVALQLHNPTDAQMTVSIKPRFSFDYLAELPTDIVTVPPNSVMPYSFRLRSRQKITPADARLPLHVDLSFEDRGEVLTLPLKYNLAPVERYVLNADDDLNIDQVNWSDLPFTFGQTSDATSDDCQVAWNMSHTEESLFVWAEVRDEAIVTRPGEAGFRQDYLAVVVNADPLAISMLDSGNDWYENSLVFLASPAPKGEKSTTFYTDRYEFDIPHECYPIDDGYRFVAKLPLDYVRERLGENWQHIRVNVSVQDEDPDQDEKPRYYWQPNWRGDDNLIGSGLFFNE